MIRDTSLEAYKQLIEENELSRKHTDVLLSLKAANLDKGSVTAVELYQEYFKGRNVIFSNIRARLSELRDMGAIEEDKKRVCLYTGRKVITWKITGQKPQKITKIKKSDRLALVKDHLTNIFTSASIQQKEDLKILWKMIKEL